MTSSLSLLASEKATLQHNLIETAVGVGSWGISTSMFFMTFYTLCKQGVSTSKARQVLLVVSSLMYIGVCAAELVYILEFLDDIKNVGSQSTQTRANALYYLRVACQRINYLLSDGVVCWRAWVLCHNMRIAQVSLILCMIGSFVAIITSSVITTEGLLDMNTASGVGTTIFNLVYYVPLLFTNIVATSLIGYKFWKYRREIEIHMTSEKKGGSNVTSVLVLLVESGLFYCFFWILSMLSGVSIMGALGAEILECLLPQISAIYLMTVILVVSLQKSATLNALLSGDAFQGSKLVFATRPTYSETEISLSIQHPGRHVPTMRDISLAQIKDVPLWIG